jgi:hypothetical protein
MQVEADDGSGRVGLLRELLFLHGERREDVAMRAQERPSGWRPLYPSRAVKPLHRFS